jgi:hypothetical protein
MADGEIERTAQGRDLIARMSATPTTAQILAEIDLEISDALQLAMATDLRSLVPLLRLAKLEVLQLQRRQELKGKS